MSPVNNIHDLHNYAEHPGKFWPDFLAFSSQQTKAEYSVLLVKKTSSWAQLCQWSQDQQRINLAETIKKNLQNLADKCLEDGLVRAQISGTELSIIGINLTGQEQPSVAVYFIDTRHPAAIESGLQRLQLLADTPAIYQRQRVAQQAEKDLNAFGKVLDLLLLLNEQEQFVSAAMLVVNEIAARFSCDRVSLGWQESGYVQLQAISHMERFERKMDIVSSLEAAMEETFDQDEEILLPQPPSSTTVCHDHRLYAEKQQVRNLLSLPLRTKQQPTAILLCERGESAFSQEEVRSLRILCDQIAPRLASLKAIDRWFGAKLADQLRAGMSKVVGAEHTLLKLSGLLVGFVLLISMTIQIPYRVETPFILRSQDVQQVSAPFEGYIDEVLVKIGQRVSKGDLLLSLDSRDLQLEESSALANQIRHLREAEKARAFGSLIDMKIAQAQADQAQAQLDLIRYRLEQSQLRSAMDGIIVEGDLEELRGAPVNKGDILFKVARHEKLFIELKVDERDIHELQTEQHGEIAFVSQPELKYPMDIEQIDPVALANDTGNTFLARGRIVQDAAHWWRPGMSGLAKIDVGNRSIIWILTHRTIDFLQLLTWW